MLHRYEQRLKRLLSLSDRHTLQGALIGLEKESLRVAPSGSIAQTPHPAALGSALTHPEITTDYSEALLELITPPFAEAQAALQRLDAIHRFVYTHLGDEFLWAASMPCVVDGETSIPIARYGTSNLGQMKHIYRRGLGYRYGKVMQVIAGVHFNFSVPEKFWPVLQALEGDTRPTRDFIDAAYFGLIRNLQRYGWLIPYLFGTSPAVCKSFLAGKETPLSEFDENTYYGPYATSLRMSDIGYTNRTHKKTPIEISYDDLGSYVASLSRAITTPCPVYEAIGVKVGDEYRQLNANILQIENEYYSTVRPKQPPQNNEKPTLALQQRGVRYVELRSVDVNVFEPTGISEAQLHFLEAFLLFCLLCDSPPITADERRAINQNQLTAASVGRQPGVTLQRAEGEVTLQQWAEELSTAMQPLCEMLDSNVTDARYSRTLATQQAAIRDPECTPSARVLAEMRQHGEGFYHFAKRQSLAHRDYYRNRPLSPELAQAFAAASEHAWQRQRVIEASDTLSFDEFLQRYFAQTL